MSTDYDAPREDTQDGSQLEDPDVREIKARHAARETGTDTAYVAADLDPAGDTDGSSATLTVAVIPPQPDEFTCRRCHLVHHRSQLAEHRNGHLICHDCT